MFPFRYFVSYMSPDMMLGYCEVKLAEKVTDISGVQRIAKIVKQCNSFTDIVILNFQLFPEKD